MVVLTAMRMTDVGVATFSLTRNSSVSTEKEQMSIPDPDTAEKMPPMIPNTKSVSLFQWKQRTLPQEPGAFHTTPAFQWTIRSWTMRSWLRFSIYRPTANEDQIATKYILLYGGVNLGATSSSPTIIPIMPPNVTYKMEFHSIATRIINIVNDAATMPTL